MLEVEVDTQDEGRDEHGEAGDEQEYAPAESVNDERAQEDGHHLDDTDDDGRDVGRYALAGALEYRAGVEDDGVDTAELLEEHEAEPDDQTLDGGLASDSREEGDLVALHLRQDLLLRQNLRLDVVVGTAQPHQTGPRRVLVALLQVVDRRLGHEEEDAEEDDGYGSRDHRELEHVDLGPEGVGEEDAHGQHQLEVGAERAADLALRYLGRVHGRGHAERAAAHAGDEPAEVEHAEVRGEDDEDPADGERHHQYQHGRLAADHVAEDADRHANGGGAEVHQRADPGELVGRDVDLVLAGQEHAVLAGGRRPGEHHAGRQGAQGRGYARDVLGQLLRRGDVAVAVVRHEGLLRDTDVLFHHGAAGASAAAGAQERRRLGVLEADEVMGDLFFFLTIGFSFLL